MGPGVGLLVVEHRLDGGAVPSPPAVEVDDVALAQFLAQQLPGIIRGANVGGKDGGGLAGLGRQGT
jgi:hypothetical protein